MDTKQVYYDRTINRFFQVKSQDGDTLLIGGPCGYYDDAITNHSRYNIPIQHLQDCVLCKKPDNEFSELDKSFSIPTYKIIGYSTFDRQPQLDQNIFQWNEKEYRIIQDAYDALYPIEEDWPDDYI